jgi:hypothetical protein
MEDADRPVLRIVRGDASPEELAALAALVAAAGSGGDAADPAPPVRGRWNDPAHQVRRGWTHGPGGWRAAR